MDGPRRVLSRVPMAAGRLSRAMTRMRPTIWVSTMTVAAMRRKRTMSVARTGIPRSSACSGSRQRARKRRWKRTAVRDDDRAQDDEEDEVLPGHETDVAEEITHEFGVIAGGDLDEQDSHRHPHRPERADHGVEPFLDPVFEHRQQRRRHQGGGETAVDGFEPTEDRWMDRREVDGGADSADGDVGQGAGEKKQAPGDHIGADDAAADAREQTGREPRPEKGIDRGVGEELIHGCSP